MITLCPDCLEIVCDCEALWKLPHDLDRALTENDRIDPELYIDFREIVRSGAGSDAGTCLWLARAEQKEIHGICAGTVGLFQFANPLTVLPYGSMTIQWDDEEMANAFFTHAAALAEKHGL